MTTILIIFVALTTCVGSLAADKPTDQPTPQDLARRIVTAFQTGRGAEIRPNLTVDIPILEKSSRASPDDSLIHFALAMCYMGQDDKLAALKSFENAYT